MIDEFLSNTMSMFETINSLVSLVDELRAIAYSIVRALTPKQFGLSLRKDCKQIYTVPHYTPPYLKVKHQPYHKRIF